MKILLPLVEKRFKREIILIDDGPLNILSWKGMAKKKHMFSFRGYTNSKEFFEELPMDKEAIEIYVDYDLGEENGLEVIERLQDLGFKHLILATGEQRQVKSGLGQVGKEFPFQ